MEGFSNLIEPRILYIGHEWPLKNALGAILWSALWMHWIQLILNLLETESLWGLSGCWDLNTSLHRTNVTKGGYIILLWQRAGILVRSFSASGDRNLFQTGFGKKRGFLTEEGIAVGTRAFGFIPSCFEGGCYQKSRFWIIFHIMMQLATSRRISRKDPGLIGSPAKPCTYQSCVLGSGTPWTASLSWVIVLGV